MPRPKKEKLVHKPPRYDCFKPVGARRDRLEDVTLDLCEYEAIRLTNYQGLDHSDAAVEMGISRSTFSRLVDSARKKVAVFLIEGRALQIEGGNIRFRNGKPDCRKRRDG